MGIDRWTRRSGFPSSLQLLRVGKATLLHQHSSKKPTPPTRDGARRGQSVGRGVFFSLIQRVGGGDPALRPLPPHSEKARERRPDRLAGDPPLRHSFLEGNLGGHRERPEARLPAKLSRRTMQHSPQSLGAFLVEGTSRVRRGREDLAARASTPLALKSWMASRTVCRPQPRFSAICGTPFPLEEARSICERRRVKASLERSPVWRVSRSFSESERTKIGDFMATTVTHNPTPILKMH